jgi:hypothetical protein
MFVNQRLVYLELHKTGCTQVDELLRRLVDGRQIGKHNRLDFDPGERRVIGSIRSPWAWYVSLWAFGCAGKGEVFDNTVKGRRARARDWRACYQDVHDPDLFRAWLLRVLDPDHARTVLPEYAATRLSRHAGLLTYRYLWLYSRRLRGLKRLRATELADFDDAQNLLTDVIRNEQLEGDLVAALQRAGYTLGGQQLAEVAERPRTNLSEHDPVDRYYDAPTAELVRERDRLIVEKYGYAFTPP